jgi:hypothetical protein
MRRITEKEFLPLCSVFVKMRLWNWFVASAWSYLPMEATNVKLSVPENMTSAESRTIRCYIRMTATGAGSMGSSHKVEDSLVDGWTTV